MKLSSLKRPFVCLVVSESTPASVIKTIGAYEERVDAFEINLSVIDPSAFRDIFSSTGRPCMATNRRSEFMRFYGYERLPPVEEEDRARRLIAAAEAGASAVDIELDMFDKARQSMKPAYLSKEEADYASNPRAEPTEFSKDAWIVKKQRGFVEHVKRVGVEAVFSCHTQTVIRRAQGSSILKEMEKRDADMAKIVSLTPAVGDIGPFISTVVRLAEVSRIPFNIMNVGSQSILGRLLSVQLGSSWVYCRPDSGTAFKGQPTIEQAKSFLEIFRP
jgi:3-dehydroquinate dehydratase